MDGTLAAMSVARGLRHRDPVAARLVRRLPPGAQFLGSIAPERWTALRLRRGQRPPAPGAFASFGAGSWIVPPASVIGPERIAIGDGVVILEGSSLVVAGG